MDASDASFSSSRCRHISLCLPLSRAFLQVVLGTTLAAWVRAENCHTCISRLILRFQVYFVCLLSSMFLMLLFHLLLLAWVEARISHFFLSLFLVFTLRLPARLFLNLFGVRMLPPGRDYWPLVYKRSWPVPSCMLGLIQNLASLFFVKKTDSYILFFFVPLLWPRSAYVFCFAS